MQDLVTVSFRCPRQHALALERAGRSEVLRRLVANWAEQELADAFVEAYERQPTDREGRIPSARPEPW